MREHLLLDPHAGGGELDQQLVAGRAGIVDRDQPLEPGALLGADRPTGDGEAAMGRDVHVPRLHRDARAPRQAAQDQHAGSIEVAGVADRHADPPTQPEQQHRGPARLAAGQDDELRRGVGALDVVEERRLVLEDRDAARGQLDERGVPQLRRGQRRRIAEARVARDVVERGGAGAGVDERAEHVDEHASVVANEPARVERGADGGVVRAGLADGDVGLGRRIVGEQRGAEPAGAVGTGGERLAVAQDAGGEARDADRRVEREQRVERARDVDDDRDGAGQLASLGERRGLATAGLSVRALGGEERARDVVAGRGHGGERGDEVGAAALAVATRVARRAIERGVEDGGEVGDRDRGEVEADAPADLGAHGAGREHLAQGGRGRAVGGDGERAGQAAVALGAIEQRDDRVARAGRGGERGADPRDHGGVVRGTFHDADLTAGARRLIATEAGARAAAFADGCAPALALALDGRIAAVLTAERTPAYLTILYALLLFRRDHELEPLHEDVLPRIAEAAAGLGGYDGPTFAQDVSQLVEWGAVERVTEARRLRGPRDNRRERFRYRLTDDAVALLEWLEARLAAKLAGRVGDSRDRLEDVVGHLRELRRVLDAWRGGEREPDRARRALYLIEAIGDTIDAVGGELLAFRAEMLGFASRPYDLDALRAILAWLDRYVAVYVARLQALRDDIAARLTDLAAPRYRDALAACGAAVADERALAPRAAAMPPSPLDRKSVV